MEHIFDEEMINEMCKRLGHPKRCPHGLPIPSGKCCRTKKDTIKPAILPLSEVPIGKSVKIAYIHTEDHPRLHKLLSYDIGPGSVIQVHQRKPVYVLRSGETDIALEGDIIKHIFVKPVG